MTIIEDLLELTDTIPVIKEKIEKCKSEKESFENRREALEEEFQDQIGVRDQLWEKCSATERELKHTNPIGLGRIIGCAIAAIVAFLISQTSPPLSGVWVTWKIIASILAIISITSMFLKNSRLKTREKLEEILNRQKNKLNDYEEKELSIFKEKCAPIDSEIERIDGELSQLENNLAMLQRAPIMQKYYKNYAIIYAGALFRGSPNKSMQRTVVIDGYNHGMAMPWLIVGLNPGFHTLCIQYMQRLPERTYTSQTNTVSFRADDSSKILWCVADGMQVSDVRMELYDLPTFDAVIQTIEEKFGSSEVALFPDRSILKP